MNYRAHGFTQKKPRLPGVYLISTENHKGTSGAPRLREGWEVAELYWYAGSFFNHHEITPDRGSWRVRALDGLEYSWRKGMWIKGPMSPAWAAVPAQGKSEC